MGEDKVTLPKWYLKVLLIILGVQTLLLLGSLALNLWINFKINMFLRFSGNAGID